MIRSAVWADHAIRRATACTVLNCACNWGQLARRSQTDARGRRIAVPDRRSAGTSIAFDLCRGCGRGVLVQYVANGDGGASDGELCPSADVLRGPDRTGSAALLVRAGELVIGSARLVKASGGLGNALSGRLGSRGRRFCKVSRQARARSAGIGRGFWKMVACELLTGWNVGLRKDGRVSSAAWARICPTSPAWASLRCNHRDHRAACAGKCPNLSEGAGWRNTRVRH